MCVIFHWRHNWQTSLESPVIIIVDVVIDNLNKIISICKSTSISTTPSPFTSTYSIFNPNPVSFPNASWISSLLTVHGNDSMYYWTIYWTVSIWHKGNTIITISPYIIAPMHRYPHRSISIRVMINKRIQLLRDNLRQTKRHYEKYV